MTDRTLERWSSPDLHEEGLGALIPFFFAVEYVALRGAVRENVPYQQYSDDCDAAANALLDALRNFGPDEGKAWGLPVKRDSSSGGLVRIGAEVWERVRYGEEHLHENGLVLFAIDRDDALREKSGDVGGHIIDGVTFETVYDGLRIERRWLEAAWPPVNTPDRANRNKTNPSKRAVKGAVKRVMLAAREKGLRDPSQQQVIELAMLVLPTATNSQVKACILECREELRLPAPPRHRLKSSEAAERESIIEELKRDFKPKE